MLSLLLLHEVVMGLNMTLHVFSSLSIIDEYFVCVNNRRSNRLLVNVWYFESSLRFLILQVKIASLALTCLKIWLRDELCWSI